MLGVIHRDVKPGNVMIQALPSNPYFVRLVDFGLAKLVDDAHSTALLAGTPHYMAPEQISRQPVGPWTDWYAFGVIAFELLTGSRPYRLSRRVSWCGSS
ncbi:MAG: protein kinase [Myxococcales bacterium]|nr:protein kinase [Myxococcales bacterium]